MEKREIKKGFTTFVRAEIKGKCSCCNKDVYTDQLWVSEHDNVYHFSCYNEMKADEK